MDACIVKTTSGLLTALPVKVRAQGECHHRMAEPAKHCKSKETQQMFDLHCDHKETGIAEGALPRSLQICIEEVVLCCTMLGHCPVSCLAVQP